MLLSSYAVAAGAVAAYTLGTLSPANATTVSEALGTFTAAIAGAVCLGGLVLILITAQPDDHGVLDPAAFRAHLTVERLSVLWFVTAVVMVVVQAAADAGVAATRLLSSGGLAAALGASETARAWIAVAVCAVVVAVFSRLTVRWEWHVPLLIPAVVGVVAVPVTGNAGQGPDHDYATSSVIVFAVAISVWAGLTIVGAVAPPDTAVRRRVVNASLAAGAVALAYWVTLMVLRVGLGNLTSTYGTLWLIVAAALVGGLVLESVALRSHRGGAGLVGAVVAVGTVAALSLMAVQTAPLLLSAQPTVWDVLLGYELPGPPTPLRLLTFWRFDTFLGTAAVVLAGALRLRRDALAPAR